MKIKCPHCEGSGYIDTDRCAETVQGRRCKHMARQENLLLKRFPEMPDLTQYCSLHGNERARYWMSQHQEFDRYSPST